MNNGRGSAADKDFRRPLSRAPLFVIDRGRSGKPDRTALRQAAIFSDLSPKLLGFFGVIKERGLLRCVMAWKLF
ncbi:MAG: hypothetical protein IT171_04100 [Acidobacteria bacterium]|nr:hypothetical protein [Acidobacteriota bacterium]